MNNVDLKVRLSNAICFISSINKFNVNLEYFFNHSSIRYLNLVKDDYIDR